MRDEARFALIGAAALLAGACSGEAAEDPVDPGSLIECALAGSADFARECAVEQTETAGTLFLTVRHPDGAFRRFEVLTDGRGVAAADGADTAQVELQGGGIEVALAGDRYRLPATMSSPSDGGE